MGKLRATTALIAILIIQLYSTVHAEDLDQGKFEFQWSCATCHGTDGKGRGPLSSELKASPPDLTTLAKKNNGTFPLTQVYEVIDGRKIVEAHGVREMPIWGARNSKELYPSDKLTDQSYDPEAVVRQRILAIIEYLLRIQEK